MSISLQSLIELFNQQRSIIHQNLAIPLISSKEEFLNKIQIKSFNELYVLFLSYTEKVILISSGKLSYNHINEYLKCGDTLILYLKKNYLSQPSNLVIEKAKITFNYIVKIINQIYENDRTMSLYDFWNIKHILYNLYMLFDSKNNQIEINYIYEDSFNELNPLTQLVLIKTFSATTIVEYNFFYGQELIFPKEKSNNNLFILFFHTYQQIPSFYDEIFKRLEQTKAQYSIDIALFLIKNKIDIKYINSFLENNVFISIQQKKLFVSFTKEIFTIENCKEEKNIKLKINLLEQMINCVIENDCDYILGLSLILICPKKNMIDSKIIKVILDNVELKNNYRNFIELLLLFPQYIDKIVQRYHDNKMKKESIKLVSDLLKKGVGVPQNVIKKVHHYAKKDFMKFKYYNLKNEYINFIFDYIIDDSELYNILLSISLKDTKLTSIEYGKLLKLSYDNIIPISIKNYKKIHKQYPSLLHSDFTIKNEFINKFQPITPQTYQIDTNTINIVYIDNEKTLKNNSNNFNSEIFGIDTEWKAGMTSFDPPSMNSIIQLATMEETNIFIIDLHTLKNDEKFISLFLSLLKNKTFIGYRFEEFDVKGLPYEIKELFIHNNIIDLSKLYLQKYHKSPPNLCKMSQEVLDITLCKVEQCSNWDIRPLRQTQLHYAATDALMCVKLYKKLNEKL